MMHGYFIFIDPDEKSLDLIFIENLDVDSLCDLLRCDATDIVEFPFGLMGYIDGEGAWQGRQQEWLLNHESFWGPMLLFKGVDEMGIPNPCEEEELEQLYELVHFWNE
ncbi:MAG: hypothetical protein HQM14_02770 [SAR324 cluster bacterium]|nr:hypothetical protein [SAR324 cluster bacterium]